MKIIPIIAFSAFALGCAGATFAEQQPAATASAPAPAASAVGSLSDAECIAVAQFMRAIDKAVINSYLGKKQAGERTKAISACAAIAALPMDGLPDDFRQYVKEYTDMVIKATEKTYDIEMKIRNASNDDAWDLLNESNAIEKQLRTDLMALAARYSRASILGSGWEKNALDLARTEVRSRSGRSKAFFEANPDFLEDEPEHRGVYLEYLAYLSALPSPELTAAEARALLEKGDVLKRLDPAGTVQQSLTYYGFHEGDKVAVRLPHDGSTGYTWKLDPEGSAMDILDAEWKVMVTDTIRGKNPHDEFRPVTPVPTTPDAAVAFINLNKEGAAVMRFICTREGVAEPIAAKVVTLHVRRWDDYRPLTETGPMPKKPEVKPVPAGVASLSDAECVAIFRHLQKAYDTAMEESARAAEKQEGVQLQTTAALALPFKLDGLPQDFYDYIEEHHNLIIRLAAQERALDDRQYELNYDKADHKEERKAIRKARKELAQRREEVDKMLKEKYPRAIILRNDAVRPAIRKAYRVYNNVEDEAKQFYAEHPDMKDMSNKKSRAAFFRYLSAERRKMEPSVANARRWLERLDALRILQADAYADEYHSFYGVAGGSTESVVLPADPSTGYSWKLADTLADDAPVQVEWRQMPTEQLQKLADLGVIGKDLPQSKEASVAIIRMKKEGTAKLHFVLTREGDAEPLLSKRAEVEVRTRDEDEILWQDVHAPAPAPKDAPTVADLSEAECSAILAYIDKARVASQLAVAEAIEMEEEVGEADFAKAAAALPMDGMPADFTGYVKETSELIAEMSAKAEEFSKAFEKIRKAEPEDEDEQMKPLRRQYRAFMKESEAKSKALEAKYPRATFLADTPSSRAASRTLAELEDEDNEKVKTFFAAHPKLKKGKRATAIAYLRACAEEEQPAAASAEARAKVAKLDLVHRLDFSGSSHRVTWDLDEERAHPFLFPHDAASGYTWQLAEPLPADSPVSIEWQTQPTAGLKELQDIGVLSTWSDVPEKAPETTIASLRTVKPGKATVTFVYSKPKEKEPLLKMKFSIEVEADEDDE